MNEIEHYLSKVRFHLIGMKRRIKDEIIAELRSHISEAEQSGQHSFQSLTQSFGRPKEVAQRYKEIYGYGPLFKTLFVIIGALLAIPTLPFFAVIPQAKLGIVSILAFLMVLIYIIFVSLKAGKRIGVLVAFIAWLVPLFFTFLILRAHPEAFTVGPGAGLEILLKLPTMLAIGYIPGKTKERWESRVREY